MSTSRAVVSMYDAPMWESVRGRDMRLQRCCGCERMRYPPAPCCPHCLTMESEWAPLSGRGTVLSWVVFHRQYFENYPAPYNVVAVRIEEGPIVVSNLVGPEPEGGWIGHAVTLCFEDDPVTGTLPRFRLADGDGPGGDR